MSVRRIPSHKGDNPRSSDLQENPSYNDAFSREAESIGPLSFSNITGISTRDMIVQGNVTAYVNQNQTIESTRSEPKLMFQVKDPIVNFTGRKEFLTNLHKHIQECRSKGETLSILSQTSSITGLGGIGKSETVRMYIKKFGDKYDNIAWIDAEFPSEVTKQIETLAFDSLEINSKDHNGNPREFSHVISDVYTKLCQNKKLLLLVFDNAEALDETGPHRLGMRQFLPPQTSAIEPPVVLVTSRQQNWEDVNVIQLNVWEMNECIEFILNRLNLKDTAENKGEATQLAEMFDRLPIAIEVAVSVIAEQSKLNRVFGTHDYGTKNLIAEYRADGRNVLRKKSSHTSTEMTMEVLLNVSLNKIKSYDHGELGLRILATMAFLSPTNIPKILIAAIFKEFPQHDLAAALLILQQYSIIQVFDTHFTIHRVFQDVVITLLSNLKTTQFNWIPDHLKSHDVLTVLMHLANKVPAYLSVLTTDQDKYLDILTNIIHVTSYIVQKSMTLKFYNFIEVVAQLIKNLHPVTAIAFYVELLRCDKTHKLPPKKTHQNLLAIAIIQHDSGKYKNALDRFNQLLKMKLKTLQNLPENTKNNNRQVLHIKYYIASCKERKGNTKEALSLYFRVLKRKNKVLGRFNPKTLLTKTGIGNCLFNLGKTETALMVYKTTYKNMENVIGPLHSDTLTTKMNSALCLSVLGKNEEAQSLYNAVYQDMEEVLGPLHNKTLVCKMGMANLLRNMGKLESVLKAPIAIDPEVVLGNVHPDTLRTKWSLANQLSNMRKNKKALKLYNAVLENQEKVIGPLHPDTLRTKGIANELTYSGKIEEALELYTAIHENQENVLGRLHPDTLKSKLGVANRLSNLRRHDEALKIFQAVYEDQAKVLGPLHPDTLRTKVGVGSQLRFMGRLEEALKLYNAVHKDQEEVFGPLHPDTLATEKCRAIGMSYLSKSNELLKVYNVAHENQEEFCRLRHAGILTTTTKMGTPNQLRYVGQRKVIGPARFHYGIFLLIFVIVILLCFKLCMGM